MTSALAFSAAAALVATFALLMAALFGAAVARGAAWRKRTEASAAAMPYIRDALVDYLSGSNDLSRLRAIADTRRDDLAQAMLLFQPSLAGSALERVCSLGLEFGLVHGWIAETRSRNPVRRRKAFTQLAFVCAYEPCRRVVVDVLLHALQDADAEVRVAALRALIHIGGPEELEFVFDATVSQTPVVRIVLSEDLRRHSAALCPRVIPALLRSADARKTAAILEMLAAWERAIPLEDLDALLRHGDRNVRIQAWRLAPLVPRPEGSFAALDEALEGDDLEVCLSAVECAGRMRHEPALPALGRLLRTAPVRVARAAAAALAQIPPRGWQALEEVGAAGGWGAAVARESLARLRQPGAA
jgi:HEAT repeat protein